MHCVDCGRVMHKTKGSYQYTESGVDNVYLKGVTIYKCECGEELPEIPHIEELHRVIAFEIVKSAVPLTGSELRFLRKQMAIRAVDLAALIGVDEVTVSRWEHDTKPVGSNNDRLIRFLFIKKVEEEMKALIGMDFLKSILIRLPHKTMKTKEALEQPVFNISVNQLSKYNYNLMECR